MKKILSACMAILLCSSAFGMTYEELEDEYQKEYYTTDIMNVREMAEQGQAMAQYTLGLLYDRGEVIPKDCEEAMKWYHKAADQGNVLAQQTLGCTYDMGEKVLRDYEEAAKWYLKAAEQGLDVAQHNLGFLYLYGRGVPQSYEEAEKWYLKAAEHGSRLSMMAIAGLYFGENGFPKNYTEAYFWYYLDARHGGNTACRDHAASKLNPADREKVQVRCKEWLNSFDKRIGNASKTLNEF